MSIPTASFDEFCLEHDIDQQFSAPHVAQQNGVVERKNHTLVETNTVVESCDVTFDETTPCPRVVVECVCDKEIKESIFVDKGLQCVNGDDDEPLHPSTSSPELIGSLLYLTATRTDIQFVVGLCARFQASPRSSHRMTVQRRYLKHTPEFEI
jgi:hypothetical protein